MNNDVKQNQRASVWNKKNTIFANSRIKLNSYEIENLKSRSY